MDEQACYIEDEWTDEREVGAIGFQIITTDDGAAWLEVRVQDEDGVWGEWYEEDLDGIGDDLIKRLPVTLEARVAAERAETEKALRDLLEKHVGNENLSRSQGWHHSIREHQDRAGAIREALALLGFGDQAVLHEAQGPSSNPPDSEASADSCERKGGTDSPETSG